MSRAVRSAVCGLTSRQQETLRYITAQYERHGVSPSFEEIKQHLGLASKSGVHRLVRALCERGHLTMLRYSARTLRPTYGTPPLTDSIVHVLRCCDLTRGTKQELKALLEAEAIQ